jgi:hypothetical protein
LKGVLSGQCDFRVRVMKCAVIIVKFFWKPTGLTNELGIALWILVIIIAKRTPT